MKIETYPPLKDFALNNYNKSGINYETREIEEYGTGYAEEGYAEIWSNGTEYVYRNGNMLMCVVELTAIQYDEETGAEGGTDTLGYTWCFEELDNNGDVIHRTDEMEGSDMELLKVILKHTKKPTE